MRRGQAQLVRRTFHDSPVVWAGDRRHYVRAIRSAQQAEAASIALQTDNDVAAFYALHQGEFEGRRPKYRGFVVHDRGGSVDGVILAERDGFCWRPLGVVWPRGRKRPTKGLKAAVQALCTQEGICGVHPRRRRGSVNRSTLGQINCNSRSHFCGQADRRGKVVPLGRPGTRKTKRPTTKMRRKMPTGLFALPRSRMSAASRKRLPAGVSGAYPMDTMARARNARSRAISMLHQGYLTRAEAQTIFDRTAAFTATMARRRVAGWNALERKRVGKSASPRRMAANLLPSRRRDGRFVSRRRAAPGMLDYPGGGGMLPSRDRKGRFVSGRRRAPALHTGRRNCRCTDCR